MDTRNLYDDLVPAQPETIHNEFKRRTDLKNIYVAFFNDFREYLKEFMRESISEIIVGEMPVSTEPLVLFNDNLTGRYITLKNQGMIECYLSTNGQGGFRLEAGEKERIWVNKPIRVVTVSGCTTLGIIQS